ncbi:MAG: hypothetical protein L3J22_00635 [Xanthomonadales bacterium]|nr:hypothetical protein [Xanthomonadales bacterium]
MKNLVQLLAIILMLSACSLSEKKLNSGPEILFVGNSLTYYNDVPAMVGEIYSAATGQRNIKTDMLVQGGYSIEQHLENDSLKPLLLNSTYDFVVLQDFGGWPLCSSNIEACSPTEEPLSEAISLIRASGAKPIWFSTYTAPAIQQELSVEAHQVALNLDVDIADTGAAMLRFLTANTNTPILLPNFHPNTIGSWVIAATIVRSMTGKDLPESLQLDSVCRQTWQNASLSADQLASLQLSSEEVCDRLAPATLRELILAVNQASNEPITLDASAN